MTNMKTPISKTILLIIGLLSAGAISFAQTGDNYNILRRPGSLNFYLEASAAYINDGVKADDVDIPSSLKNLFGSSLAFGWRIDEHQKIQLESGYYTSSATANSNYDNWEYGTHKFTVDVMPVLFSYSYCLPLGDSGRYELRLTPIVGFYSMKVKVTHEYITNGVYNTDPDQTGSSTPFVYGVGVGFTWHFSRMFYADAGYRLIRRGGLTVGNGPYNAGASVKSAFTNWLTVSIGWKL